MSRLNTQIYEEASEWIILHRSEDLDPEAKRRFDAWLRESPQHLRAYLEMSSIWEDVPALNQDWNPSADQLLARAREEVNVFPLDLKAAAVGDLTNLGSVPTVDDAQSPAVLREASQQPALQSASVLTVPASQHLATKLLAIAAMIVLTVGLSAWFYLQRGLYKTDTGEQLTIALTDGSTIELNARTKLRVHYTDQERSIDLVRGQALFKVAKDPNRPFIVDSDGTRVRAVGTQFEVYKRNTGTQITVVEGRVAVAEQQGRMVHEAAHRATAHSALQAHLGEVLVSAGEQILIAQSDVAPEFATSTSDAGTVPIAPKTSTRAPLKVQHANIEAATAWTQQRLVFEFATLDEVAEEFNRYNRRRLVIECDEAGSGASCLSDFHITGSFSSTDPTLLLRFLRDQPGIVLNETSDEIRISPQDASNG